MPATPGKAKGVKALATKYPNGTALSAAQYAKITEGDHQWLQDGRPKVDSNSTLRQKVGAMLWRGKNKDDSKCWTCLDSKKAMPDLSKPLFQADGKTPRPPYLACGCDVEIALFEECCVLFNIFERDQKVNVKASEGGKPKAGGKSRTVMFDLWKKLHCVPDVEEDYKFDVEQFFEEMENNGWPHPVF